MPDFLPQQLQEWSGGRWVGLPQGPIRGFTFDSRQAKSGDLFVCLKTEKRDGHDFLPDAARAGAAAALVAKVQPEVNLPQLVVPDPLEALQRMAALHRMSFPGPVVGISGSCGKTSTKNLLALLLGGAPDVHATEGNLNNTIGVPVTLLGLDPSCHVAAVIEAGINHPGEMRVLAEMIQPSHAIITMVGAAHLEQLKTLENVAREKAVLPQSVYEGGVVLFPKEVLVYEPFRQMRARAVSPEFSIEQGEEATVVRIADAGGAQEYKLRRVSQGMASNAVLAIAMARVLGVPHEMIVARLEEWKPARFRGEWTEVGQAKILVDCYNANPSAMKDALAYFDETVGRAAPRIFVFGCMGELGTNSPSLHEEVGRALPLAPADRVYVTGADAEFLREGIQATAGGEAQVEIFSDVNVPAQAIATHRGPVFLKGSRVYGLEAILEAAQVGKAAVC
jgi:UDP-N-acetylmuramoyl-tripeptide--D-alanyl-D-alanine ligase